MILMMITKTETIQTNLYFLTRIPNVAFGTKPYCSSVWFSSVKNDFVPIANKSKSNESFLKNKIQTISFLEKQKILLLCNSLFNIFYCTCCFHFYHIRLLTIMRTNTKCTEWNGIISIRFIFTCRT